MSGTPASRLPSEIAGQLQRLRREQRIPARELATRCAELGMPSLTRSTIAKIESGVRNFVTVAEAVTLAQALGVPPGELLGSFTSPPAGTVVVGDVPQEPTAFQPRPGLTAALERKPEGGRVSVVFAVTGIRGVGKTQVAAACARQRIAERWRLVAWVDATDEASVLVGLAQVAVAAGMGSASEDARMLAAGVRHWLEADGERRLLVFDNATDLDGLRPFLPAGGAAQVVITSSRRSVEGLGTPVPVDVFTENEALAFLAKRTRLDDHAGARELGRELGFLPLGLAQAAALIAHEHLSYATYLGRLRALPVANYLRRAEGDSYPYRLAEAVVLSLRAAEARDPYGVCARLVGLVAVLAETGVPRWVLHLAASAGVLGHGQVGAAEVDAGVGILADASLLGFTVDESVVAHRLVMRVTRERLAAEGGLSMMLAGTVKVLEEVADRIREPWRDPARVRELAEQVSAVVAHAASHPDAVAGVATGLLRLRLQSVYLLNMLGDSTGLAIAAAEPLAVECDRLLGADHPDTLSACVNLAHAYRAAGRTSEAILLLERTLADRERILGGDHPDTLQSRNNLAMAYQDAGRMSEAVPMYERTLADRERILGGDHPDTLQSRNNLAAAYRAAGQMSGAVPMYERTLADRERILGGDHPDTLRSRNNLAAAYRAAGRTSEAILLLERTLADRERILGGDHPDTLQSRNNLAMAYQDAGRMSEAVPMYERTLADRERILGGDHPDTLRSRNNLAMAYQDAGRMSEAISLNEHTLADCERLLGTDHPATLTSRNNLAAAYQSAGRTAEAIPILERTLADCERLLGTDHPDTLTSRNNLAAAYQSAGRTAKAST
jgi:tetratricopeptide (TPR) repeat protein/transcriptional regulator with XRE-family HTH domain